MIDAWNEISALDHRLAKQITANTILPPGTGWLAIVIGQGSLGYTAVQFALEFHSSSTRDSTSELKAASDSSSIDITEHDLTINGLAILQSVLGRLDLRGDSRIDYRHTYERIVGQLMRADAFPFVRGDLNWSAFVSLRHFYCAHPTRRRSRPPQSRYLPYEQPQQLRPRSRLACVPSRPSHSNQLNRQNFQHHEHPTTSCSNHIASWL